MPKTRTTLIWASLTLALVAPVVAAATSPLLAWRQPIYILAGFAGVIALALLLLQPILAGGYLPGLKPRHARQVHRWTGAALVLAVVVHVAGLWITSPPDVIDALTFTSPTPFSNWGVTAMWALFASGAIAVMRKPLKFRPLAWRRAHSTLALVIVLGSVVHAMLIEGTMEIMTKSALCALVLLATAKALIDLRAWTGRRDRKP